MVTGLASPPLPLDNQPVTGEEQQEEADLVSAEPARVARPSAREAGPRA